jgi:hypothetical protein
LGKLKAEPITENLRGYKTNLLQHVTRINKSIMPKVLSSGQNGRIRLGTPLSGLVDESETGLNCYGLLLLLLSS